MSCENLIQFNVEALNRNKATMFAALKFVNQENYAQMKERYSATVPGYFDGDYENFKKERNKLTQLFIAAGYTSLQESYYRHSLSPEGAKAYAECVARTAQKPIAAWIEKVTDDFVAVGVRCGLGGSVNVKYEVYGATPKNAPSILKAGGSEVLLFDYNPKQPFIVAINATVQESGAQDSVVVDLPKVRNFEIRKEQKEVSGQMMAGAGCQGNTAGCQIYRDVILVADQDYYLLPNTLRVVREESFGSGLMRYSVSWVQDANEGPVRRMVGHPYGFEGNSGDTQGIGYITWAVTAEREYIVEVA